jgi:adenylate cyclase
VERKLAAIFAADIAGYSRLMARDEIGTLGRLHTCRAIIDELIASHRGRVFNTAGDSVVADFASAVDAVQCAVAVQAAIATENADGIAVEPMQFRIGVHVGDVMVDGENLLGDGVNIAARLEGLAEPGAICVSAVVRDQVGNRLPVAFDDLGDQHVKNIAQAIRVYRVQAGTPAMRPVAALPLPDKPSIAVLPFQNMSGDPEQEYFADGMVEEIITALSRIRWLFVIARNSSFTYRGKPVDVKQIGRELGIRYVLKGSVRKGGNRIRITAQLIEAASGAHLWADRFDGSLEDVFDLQEQVALGVAAVIEPALQAAERDRSATRRTEDLTAYDLYLRASQIGMVERERLREAATLLDQAIERDPNYGPALGTAARVRVQLDIAGASADPVRNEAEAIALARRAVEAAPNDPVSLASATFALGYFGEDIDAAITLMDRALSLNPSFARAWMASGLLRIYAGDLDVAIEHIEKSMRLDPRANMAVHLCGIGIAHFFAQRFEMAPAKLLAAIQQRPSSLTPYRFLAASYTYLGRLAEARGIIAKLRVINAEAEPRVTHWRKPEHQELILSGLRLAMGKTG